MATKSLYNRQMCILLVFTFLASTFTKDNRPPLPFAVKQLFKPETPEMGPVGETRSGQKLLEDPGWRHLPYGGTRGLISDPETEPEIEDPIIQSELHHAEVVPEQFSPVEEVKILSEDNDDDIVVVHDDDDDDVKILKSDLDKIESRHQTGSGTTTDSSPRKVSVESLTVDRRLIKAKHDLATLQESLAVIMEDIDTAVNKKRKKDSSNSKDSAKPRSSPDKDDKESEDEIDILSIKLKKPGNHAKKYHWDDVNRLKMNQGRLRRFARRQMRTKKKMYGLGLYN